jgi:lysophospholipase L1-like esterase
MFTRGLMAAAVAAATLAGAPALAQETDWIASWGTAPTPPRAATGNRPGTASYENVTLRQIVRLSAGGEAVRVRLTNEYGEGRLEIGAASIALADADGAIIEGSVQPLTFAGQPTASIAPAAPLVSDPVEMSLDDLANLSISLYFPEDTGPCTCHGAAMATGYVSAEGDHTAGAFEAADTIRSRAFITGVEVLAPAPAKTVVTLGDSITDGIGSTSNANHRWPDYLAERLAAHEDDVTWGVVNVGISGNQVLNTGAGESALARFDRDVLARAGVAYVIVFEGVNDLGINFGRGSGDLTADEMIAGYRQLITRAHANDVKIFGATIAPYEGASYWSEDGEAARQAINTWMRESGEFDAILDFAAAFADPEHPTQMLEGLHAGDHLHGSDAGYEAVAASIDLSLFE